MEPSTPAAGLRDLDENLIADCIHCGLCLETCPTFVETGREEESPRGRLLLARGLATGRWAAEETLLGHLDLCLGCRACETVCPSGVRYGDILESARAATVRERKKPRNRFEQFLVRHVFWRGSLLETWAPVYRWTRAWRVARGLARLPGVPGRLRTRLRLVPEPEGPWPTSTGTGNPAGPSVYLLRGCVARALFPGSEAATVALLQEAGYAVTSRNAPGCCGALAAHAGERDLALGFGRELLELATEGDSNLVTTAAGCGAHLKNLAHHFHGTAFEAAAAEVETRTLDLTEALERAPRPLRFSGEKIPVVYQDACHLRHGQGITGEPRRLLGSAGAELLEAEESDLCCGSAGTYNIGRDSMADRLGRRKAEVLRRTGARVVVTANPGCALQLRAHLHRKGDPEVQTLPRFLAARIRSNSDSG